MTNRGEPCFGRVIDMQGVQGMNWWARSEGNLRWQQVLADWQWHEQCVWQTSRLRERVISALQIYYPPWGVCVLESKQETKKEKSTNVFQSDKHVIYCCWCDFCPHPNSTSRLFPETSPLCSSVPHLISSFPVKTQPAYWFHPTVNTGSHPIAGSRLHGGEMHGWDSRINLISALR